jgi:hypothetical protein
MNIGRSVLYAKERGGKYVPLVVVVVVSKKKEVKNGIVSIWRAVL